jgi:carbamoyl-phosphate synthase small subunit
MKAQLVLEDGRSFQGRSFGATGETGGEVCFNTSMSGYQEILTDPSYRGQLICMTYPLIGNSGSNEADAESSALHARGLIVKEVSAIASNYRNSHDLPSYLGEAGVLGIEGLDTRALTKHLRSKGSMRGMLATGEEQTVEQLAAKAKALPGLHDQDLVGEVTTREPYEWTIGFEEEWIGPELLPSAADRAGREIRHVVAYDFGMKRGILRGLVRSGCRVTVVPARTPAAEALAMKPDGIFLSNGPGDPATLSEIVGEVQKLVGQVPIFGICLGHQILAQVFGAKTFKMKFGHRGANHPVKDLATGKIEITSQNHGYAVDTDSLSDEVEASHVNLNDETLEGLRHLRLPVFSVQYHPEASPGPHDACYLFARFMESIEAAKQPA